jgi:hypothetical protein
LVSSSKLSLKQRATFGFLLDNAKLLKDKEAAMQIMRQRIKLRDKSLRWQLPILLYYPSRRTMQMAHYKELEKKLDKMERARKKAEEKRKVQLVGTSVGISGEIPIPHVMRAISPDYASMFLKGSSDGGTPSAAATLDDTSTTNSFSGVGGGGGGGGFSRRSLRRGSHAPVTDNKMIDLKHRMELLSAAAKTAGLLSKLNFSSSSSAPITSGEGGMKMSEGGVLGEDDSAVIAMMAKAFAKGKDKYGAAYLSPHRMKCLVKNMRGKVVMPPAPDSSSSSMMKKSQPQQQQQQQHKEQNENKSGEGSNSVKGMSSLKSIVMGCDDEDEDDDDDDANDANGGRDRTKNKKDQQKKKDNKTSKEDDLLFDEEEEKLDSLIDFAVELFRNKVVRADQILLLLESLVSPVQQSHHGTTIDTSEARSVAMPDLHSQDKQSQQHHHHKHHHHHHHHKHHPNNNKKKGATMMMNKKELVEYDAESVLVACRLLLTGIGYCLDTMGDQADASATKNEILRNEAGTEDIWHTNISAGVSFGGHPNAHVTHGHKNFTSGFSMVNDVPLRSLPQMQANPRHVGALSRIMRMISEAASSFRIPDADSMPLPPPSPSPDLHPSSTHGVGGNHKAGDSHRSANDKGAQPMYPSSTSSVYVPSPTLNPYQREPLLKKMWDVEDYRDVDEDEEGEEEGDVHTHSAADASQPKLKIHKHKKEDNNKKNANSEAKKDKEEDGKSSKHASIDIPDHCDAEVAETLSSAARFLHLVRKLKWDVKVATGVDRESYVKLRQKEMDIQRQKDLVEEENKKRLSKESGVNNNNNNKEEEEGDNDDTHSFVDVASQNSDVQDYDYEEGPPPHNYVRGASRTPKGKHRRQHEKNERTENTSSSSLESFQQSLDNGIRVQEEDASSSSSLQSGSKTTTKKKNEDKGSDEALGWDAGGHQVPDDIGSWICPLTGCYLWREDRTHHLLSHPEASKAYIECWKQAFENLKKILKQTHIRRRALLIHRQAHMTFAEALCCLIDCKGNENLVFERLTKKPSPSSSSSSSSNNNNNIQVRKEEGKLDRCGDVYQAEMRLGAALIGKEACQWVSEKRVRKEWNDILERKKNGGIPSPVRDHHHHHHHHPKENKDVMRSLKIHEGEEEDGDDGEEEDATATTNNESWVGPQSLEEWW